VVLMTVPGHSGEGRADDTSLEGGGEGWADSAVEGTRWRGHGGSDRVRVYGLGHT
jgi:hypothetical protein